jgi:hypothetical protein
MRIDGTDRIVVDSGRSGCAYVTDSGWIIYINLDDNWSLYKIRTDGSGKQKIGNYFNLFQISGIVDDKVYLGTIEILI